jgi:hypothetical protein
MTGKNEIVTQLGNGQTRFGAWKVRIESSIHSHRYQAYIRGPINTVVDQPITEHVLGLKDIYDRAAAKLLTLYQQYPGTDPKQYFTDIEIKDAFKRAYPKLARACKVQIKYIGNKQQVWAVGTMATSVYSVFESDKKFGDVWRFRFIGSEIKKKEKEPA